MKFFQNFLNLQLISSISAEIYYDLFPNNYTSYRNLITTVEDTTQTLTFEPGSRIPSWLNGEVFHAGPGRFEFGDQTYKNMIDGSSSVQKFKLIGAENKVIYDRKFMNSQTYQDNLAANKIVYTEVGTYGEPDWLLDGLKPWNKKEIAQRRLDYFAVNQTDNTDVKMHLIGGNLWSYSETPWINVIDTDSLEIVKRLDIRTVAPANPNNLTIITQTAHGFIDENLDFYNSVTGFEFSPANGVILKPVHYVYKLPKANAPEADVDTVFDTIEWSEKIEIPARPGKAGYYHDCVHTEHYFIMPFQSIEVSLLKSPINIARGKPISDVMDVNPERDAFFVVVDKQTLTEVARFTLPYFVSGHTINAYETDDGKIVYDCFRTFKNFFNLAVIEFSNVTGPALMENTLEYGPENRAWRLIFDMNLPENQRNAENPGPVEAFEHFPDSLEDSENWGSFLAQGIEFPRVQDHLMEHDYDTFYSVGMGSLIPGDRVYRSDIKNKLRKVWMEPGYMVTEPLVVMRPQKYVTQSAVDDQVEGIIGVYGTPFREDEKTGKLGRSFYAILDEKTLEELGRAYFPEDIRLCTAFHVTYKDCTVEEAKSPDNPESGSVRSYLSLVAILLLGMI